MLSWEELLAAVKHPDIYSGYYFTKAEMETVSGKRQCVKVWKRTFGGPEVDWQMVYGPIDKEEFEELKANGVKDWK